MKTTFLLGLPRCGSLALSVMTNTSSCVSHHEGHDFTVMPKWRNTYAYTAWMAAKQSKKNYFCCDVSSCLDLISAFLKFKKELSESKDTFQLIYIESCIDRCVDSFERIGISNAYSYAYLHGMSHRIRTLLEAAHKDKEWNILEINKEQGESINGSKFFTRSQLTEITRYVGSHTNDSKSSLSKIELDKLEYLRRCHISLSPDLLNENIKRYSDNILNFIENKVITKVIYIQ